MIALANKKVLVLGLSPSGISAARFLKESGADAMLLDPRDTLEIRRAKDDLDLPGVTVKIGANFLPKQHFDFAVVTPEIPPRHPLLVELREKEIPIIGELELGYQQSLCLHIAVTGTNGKTIATQVIENILTQCQRKTLIANETHAPLTSLIAATKELDFLTLEASVFQLEHTKFFRPTIAILLNTAQDHLDRYESMAEYIQTKARIFQNQQAFDWAIVQSEALAQLRALNVPMPAKVITFSANNRRADIFLDRGLIVSRLDGWAGPLVDMELCKIRGPHNAEILMAALAVCRVLRLPLEVAVEAIKNYELPPHRCELVAESNGVKFINDARASNPGALQRALLSFPETREPNIWLIAGGRDKRFDFHELGPLLSQRVKGAFLIGEAREKMRAAWSLFTPCTLAESLLEAVAEITKLAEAGEIVLFSPACSSLDQFRSYQHRGEVYRKAVGESVRQKKNEAGRDESEETKSPDTVTSEK